MSGPVTGLAVLAVQLAGVSSGQAGCCLFDCIVVGLYTYTLHCSWLVCMHIHIHKLYTREHAMQTSIHTCEHVPTQTNIHTPACPSQLNLVDVSSTHTHTHIHTPLKAVLPVP